MAPATPDLTYPTAAGAHYAARQAMLRARAADGRTRFNATDHALGMALLGRLLMCVDAADGGLAGLDDNAREARLADLRAPESAIRETSGSSGDWATELVHAATAVAADVPKAVESYGSRPITAADLAQRLGARGQRSAA